MASTYNKFNKFALDLINGVHDFDADTFYVYLTNTAPDAENDTVKADLAEIAPSPANGYAAQETTITTSRALGVAKITGSDVVFTASGGSFGPFRYAVLYNDTPSSPTDPLIAWWDYGAEITLLDTETFTIDFDASAGIATLT